MMCGDTFMASGRTNPEGVKQLANILGTVLDVGVVGVPLTEVLHLKTGAVYLENGADAHRG